MTDLVSLGFIQDFMLTDQITENTGEPISNFIPWSVNCILYKKITPFILGNMNTERYKHVQFYLEVAEEELWKMYLYMA